MYQYAHANAVGVALKDARGVHFMPYAGNHPKRQHPPARLVETAPAVIPAAQPLSNTALPANFNPLLLLPALLG